jgi:hypothetical protein
MEGDSLRRGKGFSNLSGDLGEREAAKAATIFPVVCAIPAAEAAARLMNIKKQRQKMKANNDDSGVGALRQGRGFNNSIPEK